MTLPVEAQGLVDQLKALLGVPASRIVINLSDDGLVQTIEPIPIFRRCTKRLDKPRTTRV